MRRTGYLASLLNHPPLIFRFQFNPEIFSEKKAYKYAEVQAPGQIGLDKFDAASGFFASAAGLWKDLKEVGPRLLNVKPLQASEGAPREFALDFRLDGTTPGPLDGDSHYDGSLEPDLATLRSFMDPNYSFIDYYDAIRGNAPCWKRPPECTLSYAGLSVTGHLTNLNIKITDFYEDGSAMRADISATVKEQALSIHPLVEYGTRVFRVGQSYVREGIGTDFLRAAGIPFV